jgi:hypothetical protein
LRGALEMMVLRFISGSKFYERHGLGSSQNQLSIFCIALLGRGSIIAVGEHASSGAPRLCCTLTV